MPATSTYENLDLKYPELGILLEDNIWNISGSKSKAKVNIPILLPLESGSSSGATSTTYKKTSGNIANTKNSYQSSNYILLDIPSYMYPSANKDGNRIFKKGTKFIVVFIGGSIAPHNIKIIGIAEEV